MKTEEKNIPKEYVINKYITLKLERGKTNIYVKERLFRQCIRLILNIPTTKVRMYDKIDSIDEAVEIYDKYLYRNKIVQGVFPRPINTIPNSITAEEEFKGHYSNIQAWFECNYDTRILHRNLVFPLLKRLTDIGDPIAKRRFKEEIAMRFESGHLTVMRFLLKEGYLNYLNEEELGNILETILEKSKDSEFINKSFSKPNSNVYRTFYLPFLKVLSRKGVNRARILLQNEIVAKFKERLYQDIGFLLRNNYLECCIPKDSQNLGTLLELETLPTVILEQLANRGFSQADEEFKKRKNRNLKYINDHFYI